MHATHYNIMHFGRFNKHLQSCAFLIIIVLCLIFHLIQLVTLQQVAYIFLCCFDVEGLEVLDGPLI